MVDGTIVVRFFAGVRELTGDPQSTLPVDEATTLTDALRALSERYGPRFRDLTMGPGGIGDGVIIMVNGLNVRLDKGGDTPLRPGDEVAVFSLIAGG